LFVRLAASVPPARVHTVRYAGVLASASKWVNAPEWAALHLRAGGQGQRLLAALRRARAIVAGRGALGTDRPLSDAARRPLPQRRPARRHLARPTQQRYPYGLEAR